VCLQHLYLNIVQQRLIQSSLMSTEHQQTSLYPQVSSPLPTAAALSVHYVLICRSCYKPEKLWGPLTGCQLVYTTKPCLALQCPRPVWPQHKTARC
jgi:hypothetical protein